MMKDFDLGIHDFRPNRASPSSMQMGSDVGAISVEAMAFGEGVGDR
jgi:hypothetical protein